MATQRGSGSGKSSGSGKRELIEPNAGDKRFVRRSASGRFTSEQDDVGRSLRQDVRKPAKRTVSSGHGDEGDQARRSSGSRSASSKKGSSRR